MTDFVIVPFADVLCLEKTAAAGPRHATDPAQLLQANAARLANFAQAFLAATQAAYGLGKMANISGPHQHLEQK